MSRRRDIPAPSSYADGSETPQTHSAPNLGVVTRLGFRERLLGQLTPLRLPERAVVSGRSLPEVLSPELQKIYEERGVEGVLAYLQSQGAKAPTGEEP